MSEKRYYIVYKTTCLKNGKYYIGCHATDDLNDGYLGSGPELKKDIARFGKSAFVRETLYECSSREEAALKEREVANRDVANDPNSYNKVIGGCVRGVNLGGRSQESLEHKKKRRNERYQNDPEFRKHVQERSSKYRRERYQNDPEFRQRLREESAKNWGTRYQNDPEFRARMNKYSAERKRKKYQSDPIYRERQLELARKRKRKKKFKEKLTTSADFRDSFVLRCKSDATLLQKTLELFKRDLEFCELLKNLIEK